MILAHQLINERYAHLILSSTFGFHYLRRYLCVVTQILNTSRFKKKYVFGSDTFFASALCNQLTRNAHKRYLFLCKVFAILTDSNQYVFSTHCLKIIAHKNRADAFISIGCALERYR